MLRWLIYLFLKFRSNAPSSLFFGLCKLNKTKEQSVGLLLCLTKPEGFVFAQLKPCVLRSQGICPYFRVSVFKTFH